MTIAELSKSFNPLIAPILKSPLHWLLSPGLMLLTVTGRKSAKTYTIPVGYLEQDDAIIVLVAQARTKVWWRNYARPGPVQIRLRSKTMHGTAEVLTPDNPEFRQRIEACFGRSRLIPWIFDVSFDRSGGLTDAQVRSFAEQAAVVRITVDKD